LPKLGWVPKHSHVHELDHVTLGVLVYILAESGSKVCGLLLDNCPLLCSCLGPPHLRDEGAAYKTGCIA
jgi:hypothetical protein